METLQKIKDEFLVCPICLRNYTEPKLLPCLHTFCGQCLSEYIKETTKTDDTDSDDTSPVKPRTAVFKCPVCRADTTLALSDGTNEISGGFSDNHLISNLMEKIDIHKTEQVCESCSDKVEPGQKPQKAEVWCQNCKVSFCDSCIKAHNVIKACRDHVVLSLHDISANPLQSMKSMAREIPCPEHKDKVLEFYCLDCRSAICSTCVAVQHRRCEMVETCSDSAQKLKPETESVLKDLDSQQTSLTDWEQEHLREIEELGENKVELVKEIKSVRKKVDIHLASLEQYAIKELDTKHSNALQEVKERLEEIEGLKKNLENTNRFLRHLVQYGSDSEFLSVFDKVKQQIIEMNTGINRRKVAKLLFRHKFAIDASLGRVFDLRSLGKIVDVVDMHKDNFAMNGENGLGPPSPVRRTSVKRTGTFRVDKATEQQVQEEKEKHQTLVQQQQQRIQQQQLQQQLQQQPKPPARQIHGTVRATARSTIPTSSTASTLTSPSPATSRGSLSTTSPSTSSDSMSSQEMLDSTTRNTAALRRKQQDTCARLSAGAGSTGSLPRPKRVNSCSVEFRKTQSIMQPSSQKGAKTPPIQRRAASTVSGRPPTGDKPVRPERRSKTPDHNLLSPGSNRRSAAERLLSPPISRRSEIMSPKSPRAQPVIEKTNAQLLCSFNGRVESDSKKCWPLDVTVLCDGTPVITDFHNKKIKAFDASGAVMCEVLLPSWPHGIANVDKSDVAVTLPEISTLVFVTVTETKMTLQKRIKTVKQYRGIWCHETNDNNNSLIIVSCCATNNQSVDILSLDGAVLHSYRHDNRQTGRTLFTWPYYVTANAEGEIIVSDCETKTGLLYLDKNGDVKYDCLSIGVVIQDPRGICTDLDGNVYLADKSAHVIHSLTPDGRYRKCVVNARDELHQPIALCVSPFGHIIVTQDNGDVKVYATD